MQITQEQVESRLAYIDRFSAKCREPKKRAELREVMLRNAARSSAYRATALERHAFAGIESEPDTIQTAVTLVEKITNTKLELVIDFRVFDDEDTDPVNLQAHDIELVAAWSCNQNIQHWLCEGSHGLIRKLVADQMNAQTAHVAQLGLDAQIAEVTP